MRGTYIFDILDLWNLDGQTSDSLYTNLRGIFLQTLAHDEKLAPSHEDFILFYVLTILHPELPVFIRDKYFQKMGTEKRILDYKTEILFDAKIFSSRVEEKSELTEEDDYHEENHNGILENEVIFLLIRNIYLMPIKYIFLNFNCNF